MICIMTLVLLFITQQALGYEEYFRQLEPTQKRDESCVGDTPDTDHECRCVKKDPKEDGDQKGPKAQQKHERNEQELAMKEGCDVL